MWREIGIAGGEFHFPGVGLSSIDPRIKQLQGMRKELGISPIDR